MAEGVISKGYSVRTFYHLMLFKGIQAVWLMTLSFVKKVTCVNFINLRWNEFI